MAEERASGLGEVIDWVGGLTYAGEGVGAMWFTYLFVIQIICYVSHI